MIRVIVVQDKAIIYLYKLFRICVASLPAYSPTEERISFLTKSVSWLFTLFVVSFLSALILSPLERTVEILLTVPSGLPLHDDCCLESWARCRKQVCSRKGWTFIAIPEHTLRGKAMRL